MSMRSSRWRAIGAGDCTWPGGVFEQPEVLECDRVLGERRRALQRERLKKLGVDNAVRDDVFKEARVIGAEFQSAPTKLFFGSDKELTAATQRYGVF